MDKSKRYTLEQWENYYNKAMKINQESLTGDMAETFGSGIPQRKIKSHLKNKQKK